MTLKHLRFVLAPASLIAGLLIAGESLAQDRAALQRVLTTPYGSACNSSLNVPSGGGCGLNVTRVYRDGDSVGYPLSGTSVLPDGPYNPGYDTSIVGVGDMTEAEADWARLRLRRDKAYLRFKETDEYRDLSTSVTQALREVNAADKQFREATTDAERLEAANAFPTAATAALQAIDDRASAFRRFAPKETEDEGRAMQRAFDNILHRITSDPEGDGEGPTGKPTVESATQQADTAATESDTDSIIDEVESFFVGLSSPRPGRAAPP